MFDEQQAIRRNAGRDEARQRGHDEHSRGLQFGRVRTRSAIRNRSSECCNRRRRKESKTMKRKSKRQESVADFKQRLAIMMRERETGKKYSIVGAARTRLIGKVKVL